MTAKEILLLCFPHPGIDCPDAKDSIQEVNYVS